MKKSNLLIAIAFLSISTVFAQKSNINKDIKMYAQVWDDIINKGEIDKINSTYFDTNITGIASPENIVGIENFKAYYQNYLTGFSDVTFTIKIIFGQGDNIVKHWNFKGKHTGNFFGVPATGNLVDVDVVTLVKMKNGKIAQEQDFLDNMVFFGQLGLVSDPNNLTVINNLYKAFAVGDIPAVLGAMDAKIVWNEAESNSLAEGNPYIGPEAVLKGVFARLGADHEYFKLENIQLHGIDNNQVLATLRYDAKVKKTGKTYNAQVAHLWTLKDGKIIVFQQFLDTKKVADAMQN